MRILCCKSRIILADRSLGTTCKTPFFKELAPENETPKIDHRFAPAKPDEEMTIGGKQRVKVKYRTMQKID